MRISRNSARSGIALIMVLMVVTVLAALAAGFAISMKVETKLARNASWDTDLEWLGRSGIEVAKYALSQKNPGVDSLAQAWAGGRGETNEVVQRLVGPWVPLGDGEFKVTIEDLDRKLNINSADEMILKQALTVVGTDASVSSTIVSSILDWIDPNDDPGPNGAEKDFYLRQNPPYVAKNGRIDDLSELLMVNGIRDDPGIFWGSGAPPSHRQPKSARASQFEEQVYAVGLRDLFSGLPIALPAGGKLNLNTASAIAMQVFPFIDERRAQEIIMLRSGPDGVDGTEDDTPIQNLGMRLPSGQALAELFPGRYAQLVAWTSVTFEVKVETRAGKTHRTYLAHLRRAGNQMQVLSLIWLD